VEEFLDLCKLKSFFRSEKQHLSFPSSLLSLFCRPKLGSDKVRIWRRKRGIEGEKTSLFLCYFAQMCRLTPMNSTYIANRERKIWKERNLSKSRVFFYFGLTRADPGQPIWPVTRLIYRVNHRVGFKNYVRNSN
jgi:hypothetical protein